MARRYRPRPHRPPKKHGGWYGERERHRLAALGIKTGQKSDRPRVRIPDRRQLRDWKRIEEEALDQVYADQGMPLNADLEYGGVHLPETLLIKPAITDPEYIKALRELGPLSGFSPQSLSQMQQYLKVGNAIYEFVIEPDKEGALRAVGASMLKAGMCLAVNLAEKHLVAWIAGAAGGPVPLFLTIAFTAAKLLR